MPVIDAVPAEHARNLVDPAAYADERIYQSYAWLRANDPVGYIDVAGFDPFWAITRFDDIRMISRDAKRFPYGNRASILTDQASDAFVRSIAGGKPNFVRSLVQLDPPEHMQYRQLTQAWFMPARLKTIDERIIAIADKTVTKFAALGPRCDFVAEIGIGYPLEVVMEILGVPPEDFPFMLRMTQEIFAPKDPDNVREGADANDPAFLAQALKATFDSLEAYFSQLSADRRRSPRDDLATLIANAEIDGEPISASDALGYYAIIATAGHDTTSSSTAAAMYALATVPDLLERVRDDMALVPRLIEEALRWATPVKHFMRSAAEDVELRGRHIRADDWLMLCYASGNCDEDFFPNGRRFDIDRPKAPHLAFGYGPHACLGQHLARQEMHILFERIIPRLKAVELDGRPEMIRSFFVNGLKKLPLRYEMI